MAAEGDRVVLGTGNAEAQKPAIGTDLEGKKLWPTTATGVSLTLRNGFGYFGNNGTLTKFRLTDGQLSPFADGRPNAKAPVNRGLAALDDQTLVSANGEPKLFLIDSTSGQQKAEVATPVLLTGGLAVDRKGAVYAVSDNAVGRVDPKAGGFTPIAKDLDEPKMLACDAAGNVYVSLQGKTNQVWKLDPAGKVLQKIGTAGGRPAMNAFDPAGMLRPYAIAVDTNKRLWVCEDDAAPKRYSCWNADGTLSKEFFGSQPYSTAGYFDPKDPEKFYAFNARYIVDNDGQVEAEEISAGPAAKGQTLPEGWVTKPSGLLQILLGPNVCIDWHLNLWTYVGEGWTEPTAPGRRNKPFDIIRLDFLGFGPKGELRYADKPKVVAHDDEGGAFNGNCADDDGSCYAMLSGGLLGRGERAQSSGARIVKYGPDGKERWRYANVHPGFAWTSAAYTPGFIAAAFRLSSTQHPDLLPVTSYYGQYYLLDKQDGLFVDALCQDQRSAYTMDHTMVLTENFNGNIYKHPKTGKTYFTGGDADCRIWELTGLDSLKRSSVKVAADASDAEWQGVPPLPIGDDASQGSRVQFGHDDNNLYVRFEVKSAVPFLNTPTDFRQLFKSGSGLEICLTPKLDERKVGANNRHPMEPGDLRVVIARTKDGKLVATRYRPKIEAAEKPLAAFFETPAAGREDFDEIAEWNDLPMHYREIPGGYVVEVALPWAATAVKPEKGSKFLLDAGTIGGNEGGTRNATRAMWSDRTPEVNVNNDIPTESRMHPNGWGLVQFE